MINQPLPRVPGFEIISSSLWARLQLSFALRRYAKTCEATPVPHADGNEREIPWMLRSESAWIEQFHSSDAT